MNTTIEHQNVEFKESWHDKYLEWICGYANASGGVLYIGRDDNGKVVGVDDAKGLLELIPSKITNTMGIVADVNLQNENGRDVIEISVDKYPFPISYYGRYYYRSGSTMRLITGKELDRLLLSTLPSLLIPSLHLFSSNAVLSKRGGVDLTKSPKPAESLTPQIMISPMTK